MTTSIDIYESVPLVYPAQSKLHFYCRDAVCEFVLSHGAVPLHPFRVFEYFLGDRVERDLVRRGNNTIVSRVDEIWVFGQEIADGVLLEISHAHANRKPVRYFTIATRANEIAEIGQENLTFEEELLLAANRDVDTLRAIVRGERDFSTIA
jgi:hypothetical protein